MGWINWETASQSHELSGFDLLKLPIQISKIRILYARIENPVSACWVPGSKSASVYPARSCIMGRFGADVVSFNPLSLSRASLKGSQGPRGLYVLHSSESREEVLPCGYSYRPTYCYHGFLKLVQVFGWASNSRVCVLFSNYRTLYSAEKIITECYDKTCSLAHQDFRSIRWYMLVLVLILAAVSWR